MKAHSPRSTARFPWILILLVWGFIPSAHLAEPVPSLLSYQGRIVVDGVTYEGTGDFKFALVRGDDGAVLWSNDGTSGTDPVVPVALPVTRGLYGVLLGDTSLTGMIKPVPTEVFENADVRLRVWFRPEGGVNFAQLTPDQRIAPVGYAHAAGTIADGAITAAKLAPDAIGQAQLPPNPNFTAVQVDDRLTLGPGGLWLGSDQFLHKGADTSDASTYVGAGAGVDSTQGSNDGTGVGYLALQKNQGRFNVGIGGMALSEVTSGGYNTGVGHFALGANTGDDNTAVGSFALSARNGGSIAPNEGNSALGANALLGLRTGNGNLGLGARALQALTNGNSNIGIGSGAGSELLVGNDNVYVGHPGSDAESNTIRIGTPGVHFTTHISGQVSVPALALPPTGFPEGAGLGAILLGGAPFLHAFGTENTFLGGNAGNFLMTGSANTGVGNWALNANTSGQANTAVGRYAMNSNTVGEGNTGLGLGALFGNFSGTNNTAVGRSAMERNQSGLGNTALGAYSLFFNTAGGGNTAVGGSALWANQGNENTAVGNLALAQGSGSDNVALGAYALYGFTSGNGNIAIGPSAGWWFRNGTNNIYLGSHGSTGSTDESNTIRIGQTGNHQRVHVAGVFGVTAGEGTPVYINNEGQLGTANSSRRFKEEIQNMGAASDILDSLRPVTFRYRTDLDPARHAQYGLIAEEVHEVAPDLVVRNADGGIQSVRYEAVNAMLLNEFQKERREVKRQAETIRGLRGELERVNSRLEQLEALIRQRLEPKPPARRDPGLAPLFSVQPNPETTR